MRMALFNLVGNMILSSVDLETSSKCLQGIHIFILDTYLLYKYINHSQLIRV